MILLPTHEPGTTLAVLTAGARCPRCRSSHMLFVVRQTRTHVLTRCIGCDTLEPGKDPDAMACADHDMPTRRAAPSYVLSPDGRAITCLLCGTISWRRGDIAERYCEPCHRFHEAPDAAG